MTSCLSLGWVENLLIWLVMLIVVVAILKLLVPWVLSMLGVDAGIVMRVISVIVWGVVAIALIVFVFSLLGCLVPFGHPLMRY